jgi:hypothetical protein
MTKFLISTTVAGGIPMKGALDIRELPPALASKASAMLEKLPEASFTQESSYPAFPADTCQYDIEILSDDDDSDVALKHIVIDENNADDDMLQLMDELMYELVRKKQAAAGRPVAEG